MKKKILIIAAVIVVSVSLVFIRKYTDILGVPGYIRVEDNPVYVFEKADKIEKLELLYPSEYELKIKSLKDYINLKELIISTDNIYVPYENLDFISDLDITYCCILGECRDWSKISTLTHLNYLSICRSDFNDVSLLRAMSDLETLCIDSDETVDFSQIEDLPKLNKLEICTPNNDISDISQCAQLTSLNIHGCKNIKDYSFLKDMDNIKELNIEYFNITDNSFLTEMKGLESVTIWHIQLEDEIIKELQDKGVTVTFYE